MYFRAEAPSKTKHHQDATPENIRVNTAEALSGTNDQGEVKLYPIQKNIAHCFFCFLLYIFQ